MNGKRIRTLHFTSGVTEGSPKIDSEIPELQQNLLWVHQTKWQKEMLVKYGNTMTLIDATCKTTLYDVPLFFVTVRTNVGYTVAAEFIVQSETSEDIEEALGILKEWNPHHFSCVTTQKLKLEHWSQHFLRPPCTFVTFTENKAGGDG